MRRSLAAITVAFVFAAGCSAAVEKGPYIFGLASLCAAVNERVGGLEPSERPEVFAEQLTSLTQAARDEPAPSEDREQLERLLDSFEQTAARFRAAAEAKEQGNDALVEAEATAAVARLGRTSELGTEYGMPPLDRCEEYISSESPAPVASPSPPPEPSAEPSAEPSEEPSEKPQSEVTTGWRQLGDARLERQQVAVAEVGGRIYVAGGITDQAATAQVEAFDPVVQQWTKVPDLPFELHHAMAVDLSGELVVLGGWRPDGNDLNATVSDQVYVLDGDEWIELEPMLRPRVAGAAAVVGGQIVVVGGQTTRGLVAETEIYDPATNQWRNGTAIPTPREHLAAAGDDQYIYAVGGRELTSDRNVDVLERYDPLTDEWETLQPMSTSRGSIAADIVDGRLVVVGGETPTAVLSDVAAYDIASDTWTSFPALNHPRHGPGVAASRGVLYAIHGAESTTHADSSAVVEALDPPPRRRQPTAWRSVEDASTARQQVAVATIGGGIYVAGGLEDDDVGTNAVARLDTTIDQWQPTQKLPQNLHHAMAVNYRGELVVLGGWVASGSNAIAETSEKVYVLRGDRWVTLEPLRHARAAGAAAVVDDQIVVVGGQANGELVPQTEVYDGTTEQWREGEPIPTPREHLGAGAHGGFVYAVGGRELTSDRNVDALERYDPATDEWKTMRRMRTARGSMGAAVIEDRLVVVGGEAPNEVLDVVELYDFASNTWTTGPALHTARHGAGVAAVGPVLYVIGGATKTGHTSSSAVVEALDFE